MSNGKDNLNLIRVKLFVVGFCWRSLSVEILPGRGLWCVETRTRIFN